MRSTVWHFICLAIIHCTIDQSLAFFINRKVRDVSSQSASMASILDFLNNQDGQWLGKEKNVVLLLGNTGVGKSTLATLLTNTTHLVSKGAPETGEFLLDDNHRISSDCTMESKTHIPELVIDSVNNLSYYDCPGFGDTRGLKYELAQTYFIRRILDYADSVKFVFVIDNGSVKKGGDRKNFPRLAKYATSIIKNVDKYTNGVALIITKVDNTVIMDENEDGDVTYKLVDDDTKKKAIVGYLDEIKKDLLRTPSIENEAMIKFIDIITVKKNDKYERIGLFRMPNKAGPVDKIPLLKGVTKKLVTIVDKNIDFIKSDMNDFGFTLSAESMITVHDKYDEVFNNLNTNVYKLNKDIVQFYIDKEEHLVDIFETKMLMKFGYENISEINHPSVSREFFDKIVYTLHSLGVSVSGENLNGILQNIEYMSILSKVSNYKPVSTPQLNLNSALNYLNDALKWYKFLTDLYESLSTYDVQNKMPTLKRLVNNLKLNSYAAETSVADIGLRPFLEAINNKRYDEIERMQINSYQLEALADVLDEMTNYVVSHICDSTTLTVTGKFVKISDVLNMNCWQIATDIRVFASNTLFIDADIDKSEQSAQISFIAPTWTVFGQRTINLNGKNATHHPTAAENGSKNVNKNGRDGIVGLNGGSGGHFFGIGKQFIDSGTFSLKIYANGGNGGNGQAGGQGADGIGPDRPPLRPAKFISTTWKDMGLKFNETLTTEGNIGFVTYKWWYYVNSDKNAVLPGKGGNGGAGGYGGLNGSVSIIGIQHVPSITILNNSGANGAAGKGGNGGNGAAKTKTFHVLILEVKSYTPGAGATASSYDSKLLDESILEKQPNGENGLDGVGEVKAANVIDVKSPAALIVAYKDHTLEHMIGSIVESQLRDFFEYMNEDARIQSVFDPLNFIEEFLSLENHFIPLHDKLSFIEFYESLLQRIVAFEKTHGDSVENKQIFSYLYSAVYSKMCMIRSNLNRIVVVDLPEYLSVLKNHIEDLHKITNQVAVMNHRDEFKKSLDDKIASANKVIETEVLPAIESVYDQFDEQFDDLFRENIQKQNTAKDSIKQKHKEIQQLRKVMAIRQSLFPMRVFGTLLPLAGPKGAIAGEMLTKLADISEKVSIDGLSIIKNGTHINHKDISKVLTKSVEKLNKVYDNRAKLLEKILGKVKNDTEKKLEENPLNKHLKDIIDKISEVTSKMEEKTDLENGLDDENIRKELREFLEKKTEDIEKNEITEDKEESEKKDEKEKKNSTAAAVANYVIKNAQNVINVYDLSVKHFESIQESEEKIKEVADAIKGMESDIETLKEHEEKITSVMMSEIKRIKYNISDWSADGQSIIDRHVKDWKIQNSIRVTKELFDQLSDEFSVQKDLQESFNKIQNGMAFLADIFDRIDSYSESKNFAEYIANVAFGTPIFKNPELNTAVTKLEQMIESNIILERFEVASLAFQQHYFPFAHLFLERFSLPKSLQMNDTKAIKEKAIEQINHLQSESRIQRISIGHYDKYIIEEDDIEFYTWFNTSIKQEMQKLLRGEEIVLTANIAHGLNFDAIKFKNVGIKFVTRKPCKQRSFDAALKDFSVTMGMIGENYYRCGSRFYSIPTNDNIAIDYSFAKGDDGEPRARNSVYKKIQQNDFFLSPYSMWSIQLENNTANFDTLSTFANEDIHLKLVGDGQYLKNFPIEFCNENVDRYYRLDRTLTIN